MHRRHGAENERACEPPGMGDFARPPALRPDRSAIRKSWKSGEIEKTI
jgi:hypothetical protein